MNGLNVSTEIEKVCEQISRNFCPERIILFGSHARAAPALDSDVDILVVLSFEGSSRRKAVEIRSRIDTSVPLDLLVRTPQQIAERLEMGDFFVREIMETGKVVYEADHKRVD